MIRTSLYAAAILATVATSSLPAQRTLKSVGEDFKGAAGDIVFIWTSPFHASGSDWLAAAAAVAAAAMALPIDDNVDRWMVNNQDSPLLNAVDPFRENSRFKLDGLGTGKRLQPLSGILYVVGFAVNSRQLRDAALGCSSMQVANSVLRKGVIYRLISRPRPESAQAMNKNQYDVSFPGGGWEYHSFPAGHFMNAIGCASYLSHRFQMGFAEPVIYAAAAGIGIARIADRRHWTSDTVLSLVAGYAIGRTIAGTPGASLGAYAGDGGAHYVVSWRLTF
jgi:membrane-associated phospholipid phosphatase